MDDVITLISRVEAQNDFGVWESAETKKQVFAKVHSVTRQEFYDGGRAGLNPQFHFDIFKGDYSGEEVVEYQGKRYGIYRVYQPEVPNGRYVTRTEDTDYVELYVKRKGGLNGKESSG